MAAEVAEEVEEEDAEEEEEEAEEMHLSQHLTEGCHWLIIFERNDAATAWRHSKGAN